MEMFKVVARNVFGLLIVSCIWFYSLPSGAKACGERQFQCDDGNKCISQNWLCDGESDCLDLNDESPTICENSTCNATSEFSCGGGWCIPLTWQCDGLEDCNDGSDEAICITIACEDDEFKCSQNHQCIPRKWLCDGDGDCPDREDEGEKAHCPLPSAKSSNCTAEEFSCQIHECINKTLRCNGEANCVDGSDEFYCPTKVLCEADHFVCDNGQCVAHYEKCDGYFNCGDESDEVNCSLSTAAAISDLPTSRSIDVILPVTSAQDIPSSSIIYRKLFNSTLSTTTAISDFQTRRSIEVILHIGLTSVPDDHPNSRAVSNYILIIGTITGAIMLLIVSTLVIACHKRHRRARLSINFYYPVDHKTTDDSSLENN